MKIPLIAFPYKVRPIKTRTYRGWKGWRLWMYVLHLNEPCDCLGVEHHGVACECETREPHRHSFLGSTDIPLFMPKAKA